MEKKYYWIKLKQSLLTSDKVDFLMSQKDGANYIVLYQCLCLMCANTNGVLGKEIGEILIPYDTDKIQRDTKWFTKDTIIVALELYKKLGLIYQADNGLLKITGFNEIVGSETKWAEYKRQKKTEKIETATELGIPTKISKEQIALPNGKNVFIDEKRYGNNGFKVYERAKCKCEICGSTDNLVIHHNNGYSNELKDLLLLCRKCHSIVHSKKYNGCIDIGNFPNEVQQEIDIDNRDRYIDKDIDNINLKENKKETLEETELLVTVPKVREFLESNQINTNYFSLTDYINENKIENWQEYILNTYKKSKHELNVNNVKDFIKQHNLNVDYFEIYKDMSLNKIENWEDYLIEHYGKDN